ncbi:MAG TPA: ABC transporter ATP-binding protein [Chloroflexota bacterium]|nr:ABC transporter ATP-binding protein [Chloroflexota bacterium]
MLGGRMGGGGVRYRPVERVKFNPALLSRAFRYVTPYWRQWLLVALCLIVTSLAGIVPPLLVRHIIDEAIPSGDRLTLSLLALGTVLVPLFAGLVGVGQNYLNTTISQQVMFDLRNALYVHLQKQGLRFFTDSRTGEVMSRLNNDVNGVQDVIRDTLAGVLTNVFVVISTIVVILAIDWRLALVALAIIPLFIVPTRRVGQARHQIAREAAEQQSILSSHMQETLSISGAVLVKSFAAERAEAERFRENSVNLMRTQIRRALVGRWFFMFLGLFAAIGPALIYWYGGWLVIDGAITVGTIIAFIAYLQRLYGPASQLANVHVDVMGAMALFERIFQYLDIEPDVAERPNARDIGVASGELRFEHVSFEYVPGRAALNDVSFEALPGEMIALVGPSGAGKTTVTYLVPRFYDPTGGAITLDGTDIRDLTLESLRQQIGVVSQEPFLFHSSIRENLLYGRPSATDAELEAACRSANIDELISNLPEGYDTVVGERGYRLSGGEKQRLALARVLLKDPRILVLDEATAHLDSTSEALVQQALARAMRGRTSLVIAHRLSTILAADRILVMDRGRLVEQGTHAELVAGSGLYARLYETQFRERSSESDSEPVTTPGNGIQPRPLGSLRGA